MLSAHHDTTAHAFDCRLAPKPAEPSLRLMKHTQLTALAFALGLATVAGRADFYVAPNGSDTNPGTKARPLATLEAARDAIRHQRQAAAGEPATHGITVWLRGGTYVRTNAFELTAADSGTAAAPMVYRAMPGEAVRLLGGRVLSGFQPVTDPAVLARLDASARGQVWQVDLRAAGIAASGEMKSRGFGRPTAPAHAELFFAGQPMTLARWPNEGQFAQIAGFPDDAGQADEHGGKLGALTAGFAYAGDRPRRWQLSQNIWVHGYWAWDWANSYEQVVSLDLDRRLVKTAPPYGQYGFRKGQRFYFLNILEELDQPGEWFLDAESGRLYFWPPQPLAQGEAVLSLLDRPLITMDQVSNVIIRGLLLEATRSHGVTIHGGADDRVAGCWLRNIGNYGVWIEGGHGHGVVGCDIENTGDGGVNLSGGDRRTLTPGGHFVENCRFQKQGRWSKCYVPAVLVSGVGQRVAHNLIHDHPHCAILYGGNEHVIEFNEIHHVALETGDVGAIYAGRDWTFRGNRIRFNFIHETGGVGMGSMGVYQDDCVSGVELFGNIFYKVQRAAFLGGGRDHRVENNIFVDCDPAVQLDGRGLDASPVWHNMVYDYMKHQLAAVPAALYRERYPEIAALDRYYATTNGVPPENNRVIRNICVGKWAETVWHARPEWLTQQDNLVGTDPRFVAPAKQDFRLQPDSPAWRLGFQPIPVEKIGPQPDELRRELVALQRRWMR
jgi:hypothetical protein